MVRKTTEHSTIFRGSLYRGKEGSLCRGMVGSPSRGISGSLSAYSPLVYGNSAGSTNLSYTISNGCSSVEAINVYNPVSPITGLFGICNGDSTNFSDLTPDGKWSSSDTVVATVDSASGLVTGISPGTTVITYQITTGIYATHEVTIGAIPPHITGPIGILGSDSVSLSDSLTGGTWTSSNLAIALADSATGVVHGISAGTATVTYALAFGCNTTIEVTVYSLLTPINGTSVICLGNSVFFTDTIGGGIWSSSDTFVAKVDSVTGLVTSVALGSATITYTLDTSYVIQTVTVNPGPSPIINIGWGMCDNVPLPITMTMIDTTAGGIWSNDTSIASIDSTGLLSLNPVWQGYFGMLHDTVSYTMPGGCFVTSVVIISYCEGTPTITNNNKINIFPNPTTELLTIQSTNEPITRITFTNILGQAIETSPDLSKGAEVISIDVSGFPAGIYYVKVNNTEVRKFVKE